MAAMKIKAFALSLSRSLCVVSVARPKYLDWVFSSNGVAQKAMPHVVRLCAHSRLCQWFLRKMHFANNTYIHRYIIHICSLLRLWAEWKQKKNKTNRTFICWKWVHGYDIGMSVCVVECHEFWTKQKHKIAQYKLHYYVYKCACTGSHRYTTARRGEAIDDMATPMAWPAGGRPRQSDDAQQQLDATETYFGHSYPICNLTIR